jgi:CRISPR-associated protein Cas5t
VSIAIQVDVPISCFRQSRAREYAQTYPVPPPSTVYGMLLSIVGEMNRFRHQGVKLAIAMQSQPLKSTVIRTFRRFKKQEISDPTNARPDYQELLTDIQFIVWIDSTDDVSQLKLTERLRSAFANPATVDRFGGLCLGESRDLVNSVTILPERDDRQHTELSLRWLIQTDDGLLTLPYWVDHVGSQGTRWQRYLLQSAPTNNWEPPAMAWTKIQSD